MLLNRSRIGMDCSQFAFGILILSWLLSKQSTQGYIFLKSVTTDSIMKDVSSMNLPNEKRQFFSSLKWEARDILSAIVASVPLTETLLNSCMIVKISS